MGMLVSRVLAIRARHAAICTGGALQCRIKHLQRMASGFPQLCQQKVGISLDGLIGIGGSGVELLRHRPVRYCCGCPSIAWRCCACSSARFFAM
jgi:hypothetical protein